MFNWSLVIFYFCPANLALQKKVRWYAKLEMKCLFDGVYRGSHLLLEEIGGPRENLLQVTDKLYHIMLYTSPWSKFELTSVVIGTDCIGSCKSNYHTITAMTTPEMKWVVLQ